MSRKPLPTTIAEATDFLSHHGARLLADHIIGYWNERGYVVLAEPYELPSGMSYGVRSNLLNGLPRT